MLIKISLFVMSLVSGIVSIGGETWIKGDTGHRGRITRRGWIAILAIAMTILLNTWKDTQSETNQRIAQNRVIHKLKEIGDTSTSARQKERLAALALDQLFSLNRSAVVKIRANIGSEHREKSGFFVSPNGYVLTADYAVGQPNHPEIAVSKIEVQDAEGTIYPAKIVKVDPEISTAIIKIEHDTLYYLRLATETPDINDLILVIGSTDQEFLTRTVGKILSVTDDSGLYSRDRDFLPGFGGGPAINLDGDVIGLNWGALVPPKPGIAKFIRPNRLKRLAASADLKI